MTIEEGRQETEDRRQELEERKQNIQTLHLAKNEPIHLVTPLGVVRLDRDEKDSRKIRFTFPPIEGFKAFKGDKPEVRTLPLVQNQDGHLVAQFDMLVPVRDSDGNLCGVVSPKMFRLVEEGRENTEDRRLETGVSVVSGVSEESPEGGSNGIQPVSDVREDAGSGGLNGILAESGTYVGPKEDLPEEAGKALENVT